MLKLYYASIHLIRDNQVFDALLEKVNIQRREKVLRCKQENDRRRSLLAGYLLRVALETEGMVYDDISFATEKNGKPVLNQVSNLYFSLSHAGDYAVCLISDYCVGVDIETKSRAVFTQDERMEAIARKILNNEEYKQFLEGPKEEKDELFLQFWTRKECYSKADGRGLGIELNQIKTDGDGFYSKWLDDETFLSMYVEDGDYQDLQIEEIKYV